jgi:flagellar biosynthesis/type III secretory pathway chaperone
MPKGTFGEGSLWTQQAVTRTLRNQMYAGDLIHGTVHKVSYKSKKSLAQPKEKWEITPNTHEPIIEREMFDKVQTILDQRIKPRKGGEVHIFAKKVRCLDCGAPLHKYQNHLRCRLFERVKKSELCPDRPSIRIDKLEDIVAERIKALFADIDNAEVANSFDFASETDKAIADTQKEFDKVEKELKKYIAYLQDLYKDKLDGVITNEEFADLKRGFMTEQERLKLQKTALLKRLNDLGIKRLENQNKYAVVDKFKNFEVLNRELVNEFIDYIEIGKIENGEREIKIHWEL